MGITDDIRKALKDDPRPKKDIAEMVGIQPESLSLFMNGHRSVGTAVLERMADALGLVLVKPKRKRDK